MITGSRSLQGGNGSHDATRHHDAICAHAHVFASCEPRCHTQPRVRLRLAAPPDCEDDLSSVALGETSLLDLDAALSGSSWMSQAFPTCVASVSHSVEALYINPFCVGAGKLTLEPGALDITGLEPSNPFALALGLALGWILELCMHF